MKNTIRELRSFLLLWGSQTVSELGTAMTDYALIVWVYTQKGTASSVTLLTLCTFLPTIFFRFIGGTFADRHSKKRIMLTADLIAACGTAAVLALNCTSSLRVWHLYIINTLLSLMNSFQVPASFTAASILVPEKHYTRISGLQSFSGAAVSIAAPALGSVILAYGGMDIVLICDLVSFFAAFGVLLFLIDIPERPSVGKDEPFFRSCADGLRFLHSDKAVLFLTLYIAAVNFFAKLGNDGMLAPFILSRTGDQRILGLVQSALSAGLLTGGLLSAVRKPAKLSSDRIFILCAVIFSADIVESLTVKPWLWCIAQYLGYMTAAVMNAQLTALMRSRIPKDMHGRVFSAKDTLQNCTIPIALFLGGRLADGVFEPFMSSQSPARDMLSRFFGSGKGSGIALMLFISGAAGIVLSLLCIGRKVFRDTEKKE